MFTRICLSLLGLVLSIGFVRAADAGETGLRIATFDIDVALLGGSDVTTDTGTVVSVVNGSTAQKVEITIGDWRVTGELTVMHMTSENERWICGALFHPREDADLVKLKSLIAGMSAVNGA